MRRSSSLSRKRGLTGKSGLSKSTRPITSVIEGIQTSDGAGVKLKRIIGSPDLDILDPFLLLDEFKNDDPESYIGGFPSHPHRGFETVTYMLHGKFRHKDSAGNEGFLTDGSVQWMTAGRGVIHSEMPEQTEGLVWGFQLWVNLPKKLKMAEPAYQDIPSDAIPEIVRDGTTVRVIAGKLEKEEGPAQTKIGALYLDVHLKEGYDFVTPVPDGWNGVFYVYEGSVEAGDGTTVGAGHLAVLGIEGEVRLAGASGGGRTLLLAGEPLNEPIARGGPFVLNTRREVLQAFEDYQNGVFDKAIS